MDLIIFLSLKLDQVVFLIKNQEINSFTFVEYLLILGIQVLLIRVMYCTDILDPLLQMYYPVSHIVMIWFYLDWISISIFSYRQNTGIFFRDSLILV